MNKRRYISTITQAITSCFSGIIGVIYSIIDNRTSRTGREAVRNLTIEKKGINPEQIGVNQEKLGEHLGEHLGFNQEQFGDKTVTAVSTPNDISYCFYPQEISSIKDQPSLIPYSI